MWKAVIALVQERERFDEMEASGSVIPKRVPRQYWVLPPVP